MHNTNQFWRNTAFIQYQTKILATRWSCQIQSISFFLIKSNRISRFLLERKKRKVFSQISLIIDCEYCTFFFSCSFFDIFHTLCWEKNHCQLRIKNAVNLDLFVFTHNHLMGFLFDYSFKKTVLSKLNMVFWKEQGFDMIERLQI